MWRKSGLVLISLYYQPQRLPFPVESIKERNTNLYIRVTPSNRFSKGDQNFKRSHPCYLVRIKKIELNKLDAEIKRRYVEIKRANWQDTCKKLDHRTPNSRLWKLAKSVDKLPANNDNTNAIVGDDGSTTVNDQEAAEALAWHYAKESKVTFSSPGRRLARITRNLMKSCHDAKADNPLFDDDFTAEELAFALQHQDLTKSPGPDGIQVHFLTHLGTEGKNRLLHLFNLSWSAGKLPAQWKSAIAIPIRKSNKKISSVDCYRPISLTCILCKLMERITLRRQTHHLLSNNLIPSEQYAFRRGHVTMDQILLFNQSARDAQNHKPTKHTLVVFPDLTKAFYRVWKTAAYILNWRGSQRLKRDTPLEYVRKAGVIDLRPLYTLTPRGISFNDELRSPANKQVDQPDLLKQLALKVVNSTPSGALVIYTDGSKMEDGRTGNGVFINGNDSEVRISIRNPDNCPVFRSEIIAIGTALNYAQTTDNNCIFILTDSRSAIQYFKNWLEIFDIPDQEIMKFLCKIGLKIPINLQWIPSHVGIHGNEAADVLAKNDCDLPMNCLNRLTPTYNRLIHSLGKHRLLSAWHRTPSHQWYAGNRSGLSIICCGPRPFQSVMARFRSGHINCLRFQNGEKIFQPCSCSQTASPVHLLFCLGASYKQLLVEWDFLQIYEELTRWGLLDLV
ncbi:RNA-directed DNA polymerase mobile like protein [Argiope bruennichi]|uniref:RNA-directed DNA polymerase mobile like protein n=1 Tax=Argiope bruennichi TaxID=94029 RepID=A0A8T0FKQ5_ARGBR|nr:RNA-directed DNA polymerase mobile like protein [Argiope bruennichi]